MTRGLNKREYFLLLAFFGLIAFLPVQGQTPSITLAWSTDTYIPLDYPGRALPTRGSQVEVVANVDSAVNSQNLFYAWFINDKIQEDKSGKGKQVLEFKIGQSISQRYEIKVNVSDGKEGLNLSSPYLVIIPREPEIVIETKLSPIEPSLLTRKFSVSSGQNIEFVAQPYFFNTDDAKKLDYLWEFGGEKAALDSNNNPNIFNLEINKLDTSMIRDLTVWAENKDYLLERASQTVEINIIP